MKTSVLELQKVRPSTVHKEFDDDVLIYNEREPLPTFIAAASLDNALISDTDIATIKNYYKPSLLFGDATPGALLYLRALPRCISATELESIPDAERLLEIVNKYYAKDAGQWVLSAQYIDEMDQSLLAKQFLHHVLHVTDYDRHKLSIALKNVVGLTVPQVLYVNMHIDTKNYFFYRKHHEHVPGIMILEVIRQAMYAQYYRYSSFKREQISLTIENLNVDFRNFVNANYPVRIRVEDIRSNDEKKLADSEERVATFYQSDKVVAVASMRAKAIKMNLFKRLRKVKPEAGNRFIPVKNIGKFAAFTRADGSKIEGILGDLSLHGFSASFDADINFTHGELMEFFLFVETIGFINGKIEARWIVSSDGKNKTGFQIREISSAAGNKLHEAIKNFTFLNTQRDAV